MVNPGDNVPNTLKAEFGEEALNTLEASPEEKKKIRFEVDKLFSRGKPVSKVYFFMQWKLVLRTSAIQVLVEKILWY